MTPRGVRWRALAPAKINPWLHVLGRRADGYHELDTGLLALDLCDEVRCARAEDGSSGVTLRLEGPALSPDIPADERNLALRAARAVLDAAEAEGAVAAGEGLELELLKRVPSRAGLGGGSSDAVAATLAARAALGLDPSWPGLVPLAAELGSDTVFFAAAAATGFARCTGRGEVVLPLAAPSRTLAVALVTPAVPAPTGTVYAAFDRDRPACATGSARVVDTGFLGGPLEVLRRGLHNDLEGAALASLPGLAAWRELLDAAGASHFRLCGSGSSWFGLFGDPGSAKACVAEIRAEARSRRVGIRSSAVTRPAGHGALLVGPDRGTE
jgi:4-diphosphocytidyl-2-C-methyl-D-erythritol kinase